MTECCGVCARPIQDVDPLGPLTICCTAAAASVGDSQGGGGRRMHCAHTLSKKSRAARTATSQTERNGALLPPYRAVSSRTVIIRRRSEKGPSGASVEMLAPTAFPCSSARGRKARTDDGRSIFWQSSATESKVFPRLFFPRISIGFQRFRSTM